MESTGGNICSLSLVTVTKRDIICYAMGNVGRRGSGGTVTEKQPVILCGKSVLIDGLVLTLGNKSDFRVITAIDAAEAGQMMETVDPAAVIVDSAAGREGFETLVRRYPAALVIAVNPENSAAMVYSQDRVRNVDDLKNMILKHSASEQSGSAPEPERGTIAVEKPARPIPEYADGTGILIDKKKKQPKREGKR